MSNKKSMEESKIVLFPLPFQGHINPMLQLANILHSRGFSISIIHTYYKSPDPSKYPHFTFYPISDGDLSDEPQDSAVDPVRIINLINTNCVEPFTKTLGRLVGEYRQIKCLISDPHWYFAQSVADSLEIKRIVMRTSSICSFIPFAVLPLLLDRGYLSNRDSKMEEPVKELPPLKVKDMPVLDVYNAEGAYRNVNLMVEEMKKASAIIFNTSQELEEPDIEKLHHQFPSPIHVIGPFHKRFSAASSSLLTHDRNSISWLDKRAPKSVLYVSFGSVAAMDGSKLHEVASGLANSMQPFLWAIRPGLIHGSKWLEMLPNGFMEATHDRGCIVKWAPQQEVLSHPSIGGFWTHCGWNSTLESCCEGVSMICSPFFGDQFVNARYVNDVWKIGIYLEKGLERGEIENAIRKVMVERDGEEMRERAMALKDKIDVGLKEDGCSYQALDRLVHFISSFSTLDA